MNAVGRKVARVLRVNVLSVLRCVYNICSGQALLQLDLLLCCSCHASITTTRFFSALDWSARRHLDTAEDPSKYLSRSNYCREMNSSSSPIMPLYNAGSASSNNSSLGSAATNKAALGWNRAKVMLKRATRFSQMDIEMALSQLGYLCIAPRRV